MEKPALTDMFDAHIHIYSSDRVGYPMVPGREPHCGERGDVELLVGEMDRAGVKHALLVQTGSLGEDNRYVVDSMRRFPGRFVAMGLLDDPLAADAAGRLETWYSRDGFRGVRISLALMWQGAKTGSPDARVNEGILAGRSDALFRKARELGLPVAFLNRLPTHPTIVRVADQFPDLTVIVDHLGFPDVAESPDFASSAHLFGLASRPNVYVKVSNFMALTRVAFPWSDLHDYVRRLLDLFGPRRLMWGSNWPVPTPGPSYIDRLEAVRAHLPGLSVDDRAWILGRTALSIWNPAAQA